MAGSPAPVSAGDPLLALAPVSGRRTTYRINSALHDHVELFSGALCVLGVFDPFPKQGKALGRRGKGFQQRYCVADPTSLALWADQASYVGRDYAQQKAVVHFRDFDTYIPAFTSTANPELGVYHPHATQEEGGKTWYYFGLAGPAHTVVLATPARTDYEGWNHFLQRQVTSRQDVLAAFSSAPAPPQRTVQTQADFITPDHPPAWGWSFDIQGSLRAGSLKSLGPDSPYGRGSGSSTSPRRTSRTPRPPFPLQSPTQSRERRRRRIEAKQQEANGGGGEGPHREGSNETTATATASSDAGLETEPLVRGGGTPPPDVATPTHASRGIGAAAAAAMAHTHQGTQTPETAAASPVPPPSAFPDTRTPEGAREADADVITQLRAELKEARAQLIASKDGRAKEVTAVAETAARQESTAAAVEAALRAELRATAERLEGSERTILQLQREASAASALKEQPAVLRWAGQSSTVASTPGGSKSPDRAASASLVRFGSYTSTENVIAERQGEELERLRAEVEQYRKPEHAGVVGEVVRLSAANRALQDEIAGLKAERAGGGDADDMIRALRRTIVEKDREATAREKRVKQQLALAQRSRDAVVDALRHELARINDRVERRDRDRDYDDGVTHDTHSHDALDENTTRHVAAARPRRRARGQAAAAATRRASRAALLHHGDDTTLDGSEGEDGSVALAHGGAADTSGVSLTRGTRPAAAVGYTSHGDTPSAPRHHHPAAAGPGGPASGAAAYYADILAAATAGDRGGGSGYASHASGGVGAGAGPAGTSASRLFNLSARSISPARRKLPSSLASGSAAPNGQHAYNQARVSLPSPLRLPSVVRGGVGTVGRAGAGVGGLDDLLLSGGAGGVSDDADVDTPLLDLKLFLNPASEGGRHAGGHHTLLSSTSSPDGGGGSDDGAAGVRFHSSLWSDGWALQQVSSFDDPLPVATASAGAGAGAVADPHAAAVVYPLVNRTWRFTCTDIPYEVVVSLLVAPTDSRDSAGGNTAYPRRTAVASRYTGGGGDAPTRRVRQPLQQQRGE